jgi:eukaryotic-like serine/threonine-protein kinase
MTASARALRYAERYRVIRRLGSGGMATVFLAEDERLGRRVAVKRLHADSPENIARRFDREAQIGASLNHVNLVAVYDTLTDPEGVLIIMEYVDGPSLAKVLRDGALPPKQALDVLAGAAAALDHAHAHGVVHRDVKPANILLGQGGRTKLADLGIAFAAERATHITRTGAVLGTPSYMAPEQLEGREVGPTTDVYALGAVAFEALSGRKARPGASPMEIAHRIATEPAPELREAWPEAPAAAAEALCAAMAFDPRDRIGSAGELVRRLAAALETRADDTWEGVPEAAAGAGVGAAAAAGAAAAGESTPEVPPSPREHEASGAPPEQGSVPPDPPTPAYAAPSTPGESPAHREPPDGGSPARAEPPERAEDAQPAAQRPPAPPARARPRRTWLAPLAVALLLGLVGVAIVLGGGQGGGGEQPGESEQPGSSRTGEEGGSGTAGTEGAAGAGPGPADAVTAFYQRAAADDFNGAWALAGPAFRRQLGGYDSFRAGMQSLESIRFEQAQRVETAGSAQIAIRTVATHTDGVDRCRGTLNLIGDGRGGWLIDRAQIACPESTRRGS